MRYLVAIPVYNEEKHIEPVLSATLRHARDVLVVDDGSTDRTPDLLKKFPTVKTLRHERNEGYGAALRDAFGFALEQGYDALVTMDCDRQHEPHRIPVLLQALKDADVASGSRYLKPFPGDSKPPEDRRRINRLITQKINEILGLNLTDAFCGFKAYRRHALEQIEVTEPGYGMPVEVWVQIAYHGLRVKEVPVPLIYLEEERAFGGALDKPDQRLRYYLEVFRRALEAVGWSDRVSRLELEQLDVSGG